MPLVVTPLACGSIEHVPFRQHPTAEHPALPRITAERFHGCVKKYGDQLDGRLFAFYPKVKVDQDGRVIEVYAGNIPETAPDLAACIRITLHQMSVPEWMLKIRPAQNMHPPEGNTEALRKEMANPVVVAGALLILFAELAIEVEGIEVAFMVSLEVVAATAEVLETLRNKQRWEKECERHLTACLLTSTEKKRGNHPNQSRCALCFDYCKNPRNGGKWPERVPLDDGGSCHYDGQK